MAPKLCRVCRSIPASFWAQDVSKTSGLDPDNEPPSDCPRAKLQLHWCIEEMADRGCQLCQIFLSHPVSLLRFLALMLNPEVARSTVVELSRVTPDTDSGGCDELSFRIGEKAISSGSRCYRVPPFWTRLELMSRNEPIDNLALMKLWIDNCRKNHVKCSENLTGFLPTRLLDIRAFEHEGSQDIKIVCLSPSDYGHDKQDVPSYYVTLSHCWGPPEKRPVTTTTTNLQERMTRIRHDELPNTFRDAARITRDLDPGLRYLWIDSLCIVQDDTEDWAKEASLMAHVYSQSFITLAALSSSDSSQGCDIVDNIQEKVGTMIDLDLKDSRSDAGEEPASKGTRIRVTQYKPQPWSEHYADYGYSFFTTKQIPLRWRAWVLQERELSRRSIHFGAEQLLWECRELKATAQLPWLNAEEDGVPSIQSRFMRSTSDLIDNPLATTMKYRWFLLAEDYSVRQLTQETDKLPALSGVAQSYQQHFGPEAVYLAGTWSAHLPDALLWVVRQPSDDYYVIRASEYIAPSWSWTSVRTAISYSSLRLKEPPSPVTVADTSGESPKPSHPAEALLNSLSVVEMKGTPKYGPDPYGALTPDGSYLLLTGARFVTIDGFAPPLTQYGDQDMAMNDLVILKGGKMVGVLHPDVRNDLDIERYDASTSEQRPLVCLALMGEPERGETERPSLYHDMGVGNSELVMGLVLRGRRDGEDGYEYVRVGLARWMRSEMFREAEEAVVKLV